MIAKRRIIAMIVFLLSFHSRSSHSRYVRASRIAAHHRGQPRQNLCESEIAGRGTMPLLTKTRELIGVMLGTALVNSWLGVAYLAADDVRFAQITIDPNPPSRPYYKMVGDISGDGFLDIVVGGAKGPLVAYVHPNWEKTHIADGGWDGVNGEIADIDRDGDLDIVMGGTIWFENPGDIDNPWKKMVINDRKAHDIELADLNHDDRLDVVARDQSAFGRNGDKLIISYQVDPTSWSTTVIDCPHGEGLKLGDIDRDGDADILIGGIWYENRREVNKRWNAHVYTTKWTEPDAQVEMADFNGDGRPDIVLTPAELKDETYRICWYEAPADAKESNWKEHVIVSTIESVVHSLGVGDLDGDGDVDVAIAEMHQGKDPDEVSIHLNEGNGTSWRKQVLANDGSHDIVVADIQGDGDLDIVGANHAGVHPLELWKNLGVARK